MTKVSTILLATMSMLLTAGPDVRAQAFAPTVNGISGVWLLAAASGEFAAGATLPMTAWGAERFSMHRATIGSSAALDANDPTLDCLPPGLPYVLMIPTPFELAVVGDELLQIFEYDHSLRRIHMDGRKYPAELLANGMYQWMGYSIGRWEDDVLVVETRGFNDRSWLDRAGHPHSAELRVIERVRRVDHETLIDDITIEDLKAYAQPWNGRLMFKLKPDWEILEHVCLTNAQTSNEYREYREHAWERGATDLVARPPEN